LCIQLRKLPLPPRDPLDTYEISDKEDSDLEVEEKDRSHKHVPAWVADYKAVLSRQEDPDRIFGTVVQNCDLDIVFPDSLYRGLNYVPDRRRRGSSCHWGKDALRMSEIHAYRTRMGWSSLTQALRRKSLMLSRAATKNSS